MKLTKCLGVLSIIFAAVFVTQPVPDAMAQCANGAEPEWISGCSNKYPNDIDNSLHCSYINFGSTGHLIGAGWVNCQKCEDGSYPKVGDVFYGKVGGAPIGQDYDIMLFEVSLPKNTDFAIDAEHKVRCFITTEKTMEVIELGEDECPQTPKLGFKGIQFKGPIKLSSYEQYSNAWGFEMWVPMVSHTPLSGLTSDHDCLFNGYVQSFSTGDWVNPQIGVFVGEGGGPGYSTTTTSQGGGCPADYPVDCSDQGIPGICCSEDYPYCGSDHKCYAEPSDTTTTIPGNTTTTIPGNITTTTIPGGQCPPDHPVDCSEQGIPDMCCAADFPICGSDGYCHKAGSTTTTTACVFAQSLDKAQHVDTIRKLRDSVLVNRQGAALTAMYYRHAEEIGQIIGNDPQLKKRFINLVAKNIFTARHLAISRKAVVDEATQQTAVNFLHDLKQAGSKELQADMDSVIKNIESGELLQGLGITVEKSRSWIPLSLGLVEFLMWSKVS